MADIGTVFPLICPLKMQQVYIQADNCLNLGSLLEVATSDSALLSCIKNAKDLKLFADCALVYIYMPVLGNINSS